jgi:predicted dinucleotide-binding enzyme
MTIAIIGTGGIGSVIARRLAAGGETLRLSSAEVESARTLAAQIAPAAVAAAGNRDALQGAGADDHRAGEEVERLIGTAGFEPVKAAGSSSRVGSRWAATFTIS